jgi:uncharacterized membrane protein
MLPAILGLLGLVLGAGLGDGLGLGLAGVVLGLVLDLRGRVQAIELALRELGPAPGTRSGTLDAPPPLGDPGRAAGAGAWGEDAPPRAAQVAARPAARPAAPQAPAPGPRGRGAERATGGTIAAPPRPRRQAPSAPTELELWLARARDWLLGGNLMVRAGVLVLFFGVAFLLKLAADNALLPVELRLAAVGVGAIALLGVGWRVRTARPGFALALQGGGVGVLYLTVFAALRLYGLVPEGPAFALLAVLALGSAILAVVQNAQALAVLGAVGGFLAPILVSTGQGSHVGLFGYYLLLDLAVLAIAWLKPWAFLNRTAFVFTFAVAAIWGYRFYHPAFFASTEPFLIAFSLVFVAVAVLYALRQSHQGVGAVDAGLVLGVPVLGFALQGRLVAGMELGLAWSALAAAGFYVVAAAALWRIWGTRLRVLADAFLAIGVVFATLAVPLALDPRLTAGIWALEGAAMVWIGGRQGRLAPRLFGALLQLGAALALLRALLEAPSQLPVLNGLFIGALAVALAGLFTAWELRRPVGAAGRIERDLRPFFFVWGLAWWYGAWVGEILDQAGDDWRLAALGLCFGLSALAADWLAQRLRWAELRLPALALLPLLYLLLPLAAYSLHRPLEGFSWIGWAAGLGVQLLLLWRYDRRAAQSQDEPAGQSPGERADPGRGATAADGLRLTHSAVLWLVSILVAWELAWWLGQPPGFADTWSRIAWGLVPAGTVLALSRLGHRLGWPVSAHRAAYLGDGLVPLALALWAWVLGACLLLRGDSAPLGFVPLLNPLDIAIGLALLALADWLAPRGRGAPGAPGESAGARGWRWPQAPWALGLTLLVWLTSAWLRTAHHWLGLPFRADALLGSQTAQAGLSVLWALAALATMLIGHRLAKRPAWLAGAGLMALVVLKLFLVDLSASGTLARIVSFISVGMLLLAVGWLAPLPPKGEGEGRS